MTDRDHRVHAISIRRRIELVETIASRGSRSRNQAATRFVCFLPFAVSLAFLAATAALNGGATPDFQIHVDFLRRSRSNASRTQRLELVWRRFAAK
jgi:hypothetical protein